MSEKDYAYAFVSESNRHSAGLTKREYFAGLAMQGLLATGAMDHDKPYYLTHSALKIADALLSELEEKTFEENNPHLSRENNRHLSKECERYKIALEHILRLGFAPPEIDNVATIALKLPEWDK